MNIFSKLFNSKSEHSEKKEVNAKGKYMPEEVKPADERFTLNFTKNGGKFIYCESVDEVYKQFQNIISENDWQQQPALVFNPSLQTFFESFQLNFKTKTTSEGYFISTCENLIADDGSILISSNQIAEEKLKELPKNFIIYAKTSQFTENISEGLKGIKHKSQGKIPSNITTIKNFKPTEEDNFLTYGQCSKNLYLLLLEDL